MTADRLAFVGMTHLGLVSGSAAAAKGFETLCVDPSSDLVDALRAGRLPVSEPGLAKLIAANGARQSFTAQLSDLAQADLVVIAPDVPTDDRGVSDLSGVQTLIERATEAMRADATLVVLCQVPPGFTRAIAWPAAQTFYLVETLVFGRAVERATQPERFILGCAAPTDARPAALDAYLGAFDCPVLPMRYESAELAKISINMCLVASISVANTMAEICEGAGADWAEIAPALKLDRRIGPHAYLAPGLGIAGGNLERDLATVVRLGDAHGADAGVVRAWIANSAHRKGWAATILKPRLPGWATLAVWGLAYKENTHSTKNAPSLATLAALPEDQPLRLHDPIVPAEAAGRAGSVAATDPMDALSDADALAILTPWPAYREISAADVAARLSPRLGRLVVDPYRVLDPDAAAAAGLSHHTLGRGDA